MRCQSIAIRAQIRCRACGRRRRVSRAENRTESRAMCVSRRCASLEASRDDDEDEARWNAAQPSGRGFAPIAHFSRHILIWVYVCMYVLCVREICISPAAPRHRIARARDIRRRAPGVRARANGDIRYVLTFSRAVSPRRARKTPRARDARAGDIHHVGALSPRARRSRTSGVDVVRRVDARVFSRAIYPARASRDVLRASARRRDARQAVRQGQATAATAARPTRSGRAGGAGTRADARVESGRVAARGGVVVGGV